ncbi:hypothetical protein [Kitasatospora camelliae]|uniref:N-acetyltransferase domain-containing protein n=1 Tax=Kitasatospora camelliae TaxID=3156397 RepID=A0AAU8K9J3_9ACTN
MIMAAARNNAEWCAALCRSHGLRGRLGDRTWTSPVRTPRYYPDAVTLAPDVRPAEFLPGIDASPGASVKDSFADLDLAAEGFEVLFEASWIHRPPGPAPTPPAALWEPVEDPAELAGWDALAGNPGVFRPALLGGRDVIVLAARSGGPVRAGAVLSHGGGVVGVSNLFAADGDLDAAWTGVLDAAHRLAPGTPVVGYESGEDLAVALRHGFTVLGPLRVWLRP